VIPPPWWRWSGVFFWLCVLLAGAAVKAFGLI
jgi:hypothetical protein